MIKKTDNKNSSNHGQSAEFPNDISIESVAAYEMDKINNPWNVQGMREDMHYFFASQEPGHSSQNVNALKRRGYVVSELKHENPDLILMEIKKDRFRYSQYQNLIQDQRNRKQSLEAAIPETTELGGGIFRLKSHGMTKPRGG